MKCPRCEGRLVSETLGGRPVPVGGPYRSVEQPEIPTEAMELIIIDRCNRCQGLWFDQGEMEEAIQGLKLKSLPELPQAPATPSLEPIGRCPRCGAEMETLQSSAVPGLEFDRCLKCSGVWFDPGEAEAFGDEHIGLLALMLAEFG